MPALVPVTERAALSVYEGCVLHEDGRQLGHADGALTAAEGEFQLLRAFLATPG